MRKFAFLACLLLLIPLLSPTLTAEAEGETGAKVVQAFARDGVMYSYLHISGVDQATFSVRARVADDYYPKAPEKPAGAVKNADVPVYYMILVDNSGSMSEFKSRITTFVNALLQNGNENTFFALATLGEAFSFAQTFTSDTKEIKTALSSLEYTAGQTSLYKGLCDALDNYEARSQGELYNVILVTDGVEEDETGPTPADVERKILDGKGTDKTIIIHTLGFLNIKAAKTINAAENALKTLASFSSASGGRYHPGSGAKNETEFASDIITYVGGLYTEAFDISSLKSSGRDYPVTLELYQGNKPLGELEYSVQIPAAAVAAPPSGPSPSDPSDQPGASEEPSGDEPQEPESAPPSAPGGMFWMIIGGAAGVLALAGVAVIVAVKRKKRKTPPGGAAAGGIFMRLDVLNGCLQGKSREFYLQNELVIGRSKRCDIAFKDGDVSGKNSRIFLKDGIIFIEDLDSENGTAISDMRIHTQNRLRSGDILSIGNVKFTFKF